MIQVQRSKWLAFKIYIYIYVIFLPLPTLSFSRQADTLSFRRCVWMMKQEQEVSRVGVGKNNPPKVTPALPMRLFEENKRVLQGLEGTAHSSLHCFHSPKSLPFSCFLLSFHPTANLPFSTSMPSAFPPSLPLKAFPWGNPARFWLLLATFIILITEHPLPKLFWDLLFHFI